MNLNVVNALITPVANKSTFRSLNPLQKMFHHLKIIHWRKTCRKSHSEVTQEITRHFKTFQINSRSLQRNHQKFQWKEEILTKSNKIKSQRNRKEMAENKKIN